MQPSQEDGSVYVLATDKGTELQMESASAMEKTSKSKRIETSVKAEGVL